MMENSNNLDFSISLGTEDEEQSTKVEEKQFAKRPLENTPAIESRASTSVCAILTIDYWKTYFDVSEDEILGKIKSTLNPMASAFEFLIDNKVDLYGPFWISTTLIFALIVVPQFWRVALMSNETFDIAMVGFAFTLIYGTLAAFSGIFYLMNIYFGTKLGIIKIAAVYGYSFTSFLLATCGTILYYKFLKVILTIAAVAHSILFLLRAFQPVIEKMDHPSKVASACLVSLTQVSTGLLLYLYYLG